MHRPCGPHAPAVLGARGKRRCIPQAPPFCRQVLEWYLACAGAVASQLAEDPRPDLPPIAPHARAPQASSPRPGPADSGSGGSDDDSDGLSD